MIGRSITTFVLAMTFASSGPVADKPLRIEIKSSWTGLGPTANRRLLITGQNGKYTAEGRPVSSAAVTELLAAVEAPAVQKPSLEECGATPAWLTNNYAKGLEDYTHRKTNTFSPKQRALFQSRFVESEDAFADLFKHWHTEDYPQISVDVKIGDRDLGIQSNSQYPFMLPWNGTDGSSGGYSCRISRAIAAILPNGFPNRGRLILGQSLRWELTEQIMDSIRQDWNMLDTENRIGAAVAPVLARFTPSQSEISNLSSIDLDGVQSWNAELHSPDLPRYLVIGVSLRYDDKQLKGVDALLVSAPRYAELVLSVPWLQTYLENHAGATAEIRYVNGRSLSPKALKDATQDFRTHGKPQVAELLSSNASESAFIEVNNGSSGCWSRAIVLPTREVLLWHFKCDSVLGFPASKFNTWDFYGWRSTGTLIDPEGRIER